MENAITYEQVVDAVDLHFTYYAYAQSSRNCFYKYTTQRLSTPLCTYVRNFRGPKDLLHRACESIIMRIVETHRLFFNMHRKKDCHNVLFHMLLYVAARVAFCCALPNTAVVVRLLSEIFRCDKGFRNLLMGAFHGPENCYSVSRIQSLFGSKDEGLEAFRYFLHHTNMARKVFRLNGLSKRMADLSLQEESIGHPAAYAVAVNCPKTFKMLVQHGSNLDDVMNPPTTYRLLEMFRMFLPENNTAEVKVCREIFNMEHPEVLPRKEQTLMRLSRKAIRRYLNKSFQLPSGIDALPIPPILKRYLHLDWD